MGILSLIELNGSKVDPLGGVSASLKQVFWWETRRELLVAAKKGSFSVRGGEVFGGCADATAIRFGESPQLG